MKNIYNLIISSILAGICISIGCIVNLQIGGIIGAILFSIGLLTVVLFQYRLFTGVSGFIHNWNDIIKLVIILIFNIIGCVIMAELMHLAIPDLINKANNIIILRENITNSQAFIRAIFCGVLMTISVKFAKEKNYLPLLFAVPVFILAGFYHCIADSFYMWISDNNLTIGYNYTIEIIGNFIGCNLYRLKLN